MHTKRTHQIKDFIHHCDYCDFSSTYEDIKVGSKIREELLVEQEEQEGLEELDYFLEPEELQSEGLKVLPLGELEDILEPGEVRHTAASVDVA